MNRNGGLAAGFLAVVTLVGVSNLSNKGSEKSATSAPQKTAIQTRTGTARPRSRPNAPCEEIVKRLGRLVNDRDKPVDSWALPGSCYEPNQPVGAETVHAWPDVQFAIATVPNPVSTHLPLLFDRLVETIQQAVQDNNYSYDASWFPWDTASANYPLLDDQKKAEDLLEIQQSQPGVLVFRRAVAAGHPRSYEGGVVIFLVSEQPTGGISNDQFKNALDWLGRLGGPSDGALRILGPTFSGSLPSLERALDRNPKVYSKLVVSSGTVSSAANYEWFKQSQPMIRDHVNGSYFRTAMESDAVMVNRFCQYLMEQGYEVGKVAFLSEDETAFGVSSNTRNDECHEAISLYYPRDIATLRSAYEQQLIFNPAKPESNGSAPSTTLRGDLSEPSSGDHDTVRSYGGQLTPLAQESILLDIANRLSEKHIQFIILRSTSSLDQIFLSQFLRRSYPEGRVVIDGADLLFNRGAEGRSLRGVMLLSTYPLITAEQDWTPSLLHKPVGSYRTFGEDTAEGTYIAARVLFRNPPVDNEVPIPDYGAPAWAVDTRDDQVEDQRPATWLTVIARRQFWPLAALNSNTLNRPNNQEGTLQPLFTGRNNAPLSVGDASPLSLPVAMWIFLLGCVLWSVVHFYFCSNGCIMGSPRARAYFAPLPRSQHIALVGFGSALLAVLAVAVAAGSGLFSWFATPCPFHDCSTGIILALLLLVTLTFAVIACQRNYRLLPVRASGSPPINIRRWRRVTSLVAVIGLAAFVLTQVHLVEKLTPANRIPAYLRSVHFLSGVSGLLPEILLIAGAYLWFWFNLRGLAHFGEDRPLLLSKEDLPKLGDKPMMPMFSQESAGTRVEREALPLTQSYLKRLLTILAITVIVSWVALERQWVRTLGERLFGAFIFWWVCISMAVILTDGVQTWRAWSELRQLLIYLDRLPLRRTLRALKGLAWGSIWKMSGNVLEERYRTISLQIESLRHLTNTITAWVPDESFTAIDKSEVLQKIDECLAIYPPFVEWFVTLNEEEPVTDLTALHDFQRGLTSIAALVMKSILIPAWRTETESLIFGRENPDARPYEAKPTELDIPIKELKPHVRAAEEFFVLPYLAFVQNILGRIRTIALGSLWLFLGTTLAISSYPFEPLSVLSAIFLAVFLLVGGVTVLVYSQMSRDATLSHITNTTPGQLGWDFWLRLMAFGVGPLVGLLTTLFPSITDFAFSWLQPSVQALK